MLKKIKSIFHNFIHLDQIIKLMYDSRLIIDSKCNNLILKQKEIENGILRL